MTTATIESSPLPSPSSYRPGFVIATIVTATTITTTTPFPLFSLRKNQRSNMLMPLKNQLHHVIQIEEDRKG
jgi:hypothetical protein